MACPLKGMPSSKDKHDSRCRKRGGPTQAGADHGESAVVHLVLEGLLQECSLACSEKAREDGDWDLVLCEQPMMRDGLRDGHKRQIQALKSCKRSGVGERVMVQGGARLRRTKLIPPS